MLGRNLNRQLIHIAVVLGLIFVSVLLAPSALSRESVRSELTKLQAQTGLSLVSVRDNKIYTISFAKRKLDEAKPLPTSGTLMHGGFSEDGTRVAVEFCRKPGLTHPTPNRTECPGGLVFAVMRADGSDFHEYADLTNPGYVACWSHDASKIALQVQDRRRDGYAFELQILDVATGVTQVVAAGHDSFVDPQCWSPDDKHLVYTASNMGGNGQTSIYDVDLKTSRHFSKGTRPTWSPDGEWIALLECPPSLWGCKYYVVRPSGSEKKVLFESESATALWWSPNSRLVAYVNGARAFERTPGQQLREMVRLRVRRLDDNSVDSFADFFDGDTMDFQWLKNSRILYPDFQSAPAH
jgi:hypothetical protein